MASLSESRTYYRMSPNTGNYSMKHTYLEYNTWNTWTIVGVAGCISLYKTLVYVPKYRQLFNETHIGIPGQLLELLSVFKNVGVCDINIKLAKEKRKRNYTVHQALLYSTKNCLMGELAGCYAATYNY